MHNRSERIFVRCNHQGEGIRTEDWSCLISGQGRYLNRWFCFGSGAAGDVFDFIEHFGHMPKPTARKWLSDHLQIPSWRPSRDVPELVVKYLADHGLRYDQLPQGVYMGKRRDSIVFDVPTGKRRRNLKATKPSTRWYNDKGTTKCLAKYGQGREIVLFENAMVRPQSCGGASAAACLVFAFFVFLVVALYVFQFCKYFARSGHNLC